VSADSSGSNSIADGDAVERERVSTRPTLSLCMIARNEEGCIARCLESVQDVVDEMIVVDTGSRDATPAIAEAHGATVFRRRWQDDFSLARNCSLEQATGDWILVLDADEELEGETRASIRDFVARAAADGYSLRVRCFNSPGDLQRYEDLSITRLFRNRPEYRYEQPIHEQIRPAIERHGGRVLGSPLTILHHGYAEPTGKGKTPRAIRNLELLQKALAASPSDPYLHYQLGATYKALGNKAAADAYLRRVLDLDCESLGDATLSTVYMKLAQLALGSNDYPSAVGYAEASLARNPRNVVSRYVAGLAHIYQGNLREAYSYFQHLRRESDPSLANPEELDQVLAYCRSVMGQAAR